MRVLLDECIPKKLGAHLPGHEVRTVGEMGWAGVKNGRLLQLAEQHFDVLVTVDRNLEFQQNLQALSLVVVVLVAVSNEFDVLKRFMPTLGESLSRRLDGAVVYISGY